MADLQSKEGFEENPIVTLAANQKHLMEQFEVLAANQKLLWEKLPEKLREETGCLFDQLIQATDRLDQIERIIYADDWQRRTEAKNG